MKKSIEKARYNYKSMVEGGAYSTAYLEAQKKLYIAELINENKSNIEKLRANWEKRLEILKKKYAVKPIDADSLHRFENQVKAMNLTGLESFISQTANLTPDQIYAVIAEMRSRDARKADYWADMVEAKNMLNPERNDSEYPKLMREDAALKAFEAYPLRHYEIENADPTQVKGFTELDKTLD